MKKMLVCALLALCLVCQGVLAEGFAFKDISDVQMEKVLAGTTFGGKMVAVVDRDIEISEDGKTWRKVGVSLAGELDEMYETNTYLVECGGKLFAINQENGLGFESSYMTDDGENWQKCEFEGVVKSGEPCYIAEMGGAYVFITQWPEHDGGYGFAIARSEDGIHFATTFTETLSRAPMLAGGVFCFQDKLYYFVDAERMIVTPDGKDFQDVIFDDGLDEARGYRTWVNYGDEALFFIVRSDFDETVSLTVSNDGQNWRPVVADGATMINRDLFFYDCALDELTETGFVEYQSIDNMYEDQGMLLADMDMEKWHEEMTDKRVIDFSSIYEYNFSFNDDEYAVAMGRLLKKKGYEYTWVRGSMPNFKDAASDGNGTIVASGAEGMLYAGTLKDGELALQRYVFLPDDSGIAMVEYANGAFYLCTYAGALYRSENGVDFTGIAALPFSISSMIWDGERYFAAGHMGILSSVDGEDWQMAYYPSSTVYDVVFADGRYVACGLGAIYGSEDGESWDIILQDEDSSTLYALAYGNGVFMCGGGTGYGGSGAMYRSEDGVHFEKISYGEMGYTPGENGDLLFENCTYAMKFIDGRFIATGLNRIGGGYIMTSKDGLTWTTEYFKWGKDIAPMGDDVIAFVAHWNEDEPRVALYVPKNDKRKAIPVTFVGSALMLTPENMPDVTQNMGEPEFDVDRK